MKLNELRDTSYEIAKSKGWHDDDLKRSFADLMALVISELAEALEEHRKGKPARNIEYVKDGAVTCTYAPPSDGAPVVSAETIRAETILRTAMGLVESGHKPEGVTIEIADALIRIGDCAGEYDLDMGEGDDVRGDDVRSVSEIVNSVEVEQLNVEEPRSFGEWFCEICHPLCELGMRSQAGLRAGSRETWLGVAVTSICSMAHSLGITGEELERAIEIKHAYNRTRSHRHGGKLL